MLTIRLQRIGKKNDPRFRVVLTDHSKPVKSGEIEILGTFNSKKTPSEFIVKEDRIKYWLSKGAQPSLTIRDWLIKKNLLEKKELKFTKKFPKKDKKTMEAEKEKKEAEAKAAPKPESKPIETPKTKTKEEPKKETPKAEPKKDEVKPEAKPQK